ncbi:MAG: Coenzyme F420 hydrogenase/dehydrogenase, beta subunit C-terminal domain [Oscillospiraceae bacterium]|nr:Coenzyme F420 hydrogenase/dehydrogenase, beta subunit C-terminal domain [Oscillospiraceae bacterium]
MLCDKALCTGCGVCATICPVSCITMQADEFGFLYPSVVEDSCVSCGKCDYVCPVLHSPAVYSPTTAYAAMNRSESDRLQATSGGVFELLARWVLEKGGVVFGAAYEEDFSVSHICIDDAEDLFLLKGAKYVQSKTGSSFLEAEEALQHGRYVLYSGTSCQIAGLKKALGKEYDRLICVDLICHGVPSPAVWQHYIDYRSGKDNAGIRPQTIYLRCKDTGWQNYSVMFDYGAQQFVQPSRQDAYMQGFIHNLYLRESCFQCRFKGIDRCSDFSLGDYWGIESQHPEMDDHKGTSLVLLHTEKARKIWSGIQTECKFLKVDPSDAVQGNPMAVDSTSETPGKKTFVSNWNSEDFETLVFSIVPLPQTRHLSLIQRIKGTLIKLLKKSSS